MWTKVNNELYHHGILGQKWGVKNGPPYPLKSGAHNSAERKAGWRKSLDSGSNGDEQKKKKRPSVSDIEEVAKRVKKKKPEIKSESKPETQKGKDFNDFSKKPNTTDPPDPKPAKKARQPLTEEQKTTIKNVALGTAAAVGVGAAVYFGYKYHAMKKLESAGDISGEAAKKVMMESLDEYTNVIRQGSTLHSMADSGSGKVVFTPRDVTNQIVQLTNNGKDVTFTASKDIKVPTYARARQIFDEMWENDPTYRNDLENLLVEKYLRENPVADKKVVAASVRKNLRRNPFYEAIYAMDEKSTTASKLTDAIKNAGYDALEDFHSTRVGTTERSLKMLDSDGSLVKSGERAVTRGMAGKAVWNLKVSDIKQRTSEGFDEWYRKLLSSMAA